MPVGLSTLTDLYRENFVTPYADTCCHHGTTYLTPDSPGYPDNHLTGPEPAKVLMIRIVVVLWWECLGPTQRLANLWQLGGGNKYRLVG